MQKITLGRLIEFAKDRLIEITAGAGLLLGLLPIVELSWPLTFIFALLLSIFLIIWFILSEYRQGTRFGFIPVDNFPVDSDHLVFVYGSLLSGDSILRTIALEPKDLRCIPARLYGYEAAWGAVSHRCHYLTRDGKAIDKDKRWASLILKKSSPNQSAPGAIIDISHRDYLALIARESNYTPVPVQDCIKPLRRGASIATGKVIVTFLPKCPDESDDLLKFEQVFIRQKYRNDVHRCLRRLGFSKNETRHLSDLRLPLKIKEAKLVNDFIEERYNPEVKSNRIRLSKIDKSIRASIEADRASLGLPINDERDFRFSLCPIILPVTIFRDLVKVAESTVSLSVKALTVLARNPEIMRCFKYDDEEIELLQHGLQNGDLLPRIARVDMTVSGNSIQVFELNADSPGGMRHIDLISKKHAEAIADTEDLSWIGAESKSVIEACVDAILESQKLDSRNMVIAEINPKKWATYPEMLRFMQKINAKGTNAQILELQDQKLIIGEDGYIRISGRGDPLDIIYKRAVIEDIRQIDKETSKSIHGAYLGESCSIINSPAARLSGSKVLSALLKAESFEVWSTRFAEPLNTDEKDTIENHVPDTYIWGESPSTANIDWQQKTNLRESVEAELYKWTIKPFDGFGGDGIVIGAHEECRNLIREFDKRWNQGCIIQSYVPHGRVMMPVFEDGSLVPTYQSFILGAYVINGKFVAAEAKCSRSMPINMSKGGVRAPVFPTA